MYYGHSTEPLAFSLNADSVSVQDQFPLFTILPNEVRDMIYEFAFTDNTSHPPNRNNKFREYSGRGNRPLPSDIAFPFLQTCKAVYLESYRLPLLLNPLIVYDFQVPTRPRLNRLAPWQFALIQSIDISLQQIALERGELARYLEEWKVQGPHLDAYVIPRFYSGHNTINDFGSNTLITKFCFGLLRANIAGSLRPRDGDEVTLPKQQFYDFYGK